MGTKRPWKPIYVYFACLLFYPIKVKTAEPIWPNLLLGNSHDPKARI